VKYELKKRAERQQETRRRIVEATLALHTELGPARTSISAVAERAGVQRHTVYSHFPDERALFSACSGRFAELNPFPDPDALLGVEDGEERLRAGLAGLYNFYANHEGLLAHVNRDLEVHETTRMTAMAQFGPFQARLHEVLAAGLPRTAGGDAALAVVTSFWSWRLLRDHGLGPGEAAGVAAAMVLGGDTSPRGDRRDRLPHGG
jgi:AcrR family transcriptional regulator